MFVIPLILAAGSLSTLISGTPVPAPQPDLDNSLQERSANTYSTFGGTGLVSEGWPAQSAWVSSFETMFNNNKATIKASCTQWSVANPSDSEIADISSAIQSVASSTGIDARFILAIVLQESNGCVRAPTTNYGVRNPGLMQSHDGSGTCNEGSVSNPCPASTITQMINDGTAGTSAGDGLKQCISQSGATDVSKFYKAARIYNSGSIASTKNLGAGIATHCYASDVANRLTGWTTAKSTCTEGTVGALTGSVVAAGSSTDDSVSSVAAVAPSSAAVVVPSSAVKPSASAGVFAETGASSSAQVQAPAPTTIISVPVAASTPAPTSTTAAPAPPKSTATVVPVAASTVAAPAPIATISTNTPNTGNAITPGTGCTTEGLWNCIDGKSFQQCGSGTWSVVMQLSAGTQCVKEQSTAINITAIGSRDEVLDVDAPMVKRKRSHFARHIRMHKGI
ncbi:hypothetical protein BGZ60DRAFT_435130 [Tricladium varicosporioides]|nr:hypothetical protein BGZ60DRAFT_435130 [Hymenoscyphus varicosporioides]